MEVTKSRSQSLIWIQLSWWKYYWCCSKIWMWLTYRGPFYRLLFLWKEIWINKPQNADNPIEVFKLSSMFTNTQCISRIVCVLPITTATAEKSLSPCKKIKIFLRSTHGSREAEWLDSPKYKQRHENRSWWGSRSICKEAHSKLIVYLSSLNESFLFPLYLLYFYIYL